MLKFRYSFKVIYDEKRVTLEKEKIIFSRPLVALAATGLLLLTAFVAKAAIFGEDRRQAISELRTKDPAILTDEERAILQASTRVGTLSCPNGEGSTNATLISLGDGRDAVISSAHSFLGQDNKPICDLRKVSYFPNQSFIANDGSPVGDYQRTKIFTDGEMPLNYEIIKVWLPTWTTDFFIFRLERNIRDDVLIDGSTRGYMSFDISPPKEGEIFFLGRNINFQRGRSIAYEKCYGHRKWDAVFHICSTTASSSSSALGRIINGEIHLTGIHKSEMTGLSEIRPMPAHTLEMNAAVAIESVLKYLESSHGISF